MDPLNVTIVTLLVAGWILLGWADRHDLLGRALFRLRVRLSRHKVPAGTHVVGGVGSCGTGHPEDVLAFRLPMPGPDGAGQIRYLGVADGATRFFVDGVQVNADRFLAAYDEGGSYEIVASGPGRLARMSIRSGGRPFESAAAGLGEGAQSR